MENHFRINLIDFEKNTMGYFKDIKEEWGNCQNIGEYLLQIQSLKYIDEDWDLSEKSYFLAI